MSYSIIATVVSVDLQPNQQVKIKGVGKHLYKDDANKQWNILKESSTQNPMMKDIMDVYTIPLDGFSKILLAMATVNQKPLKFEINDSFAITSISLLNV